eukprot:CAMPEP_0202100068 /NCGR_PEP_ID=MMETSP0965-20130614/2919_1 /ASSEMBLY_ACC=CAM_ASM_000507 /TAXON_ID=4773 /ORGANISM="Schizochytrium aggregatum, Strain ATCC28209" /LENGTH=74 /DNA_ID=CAMNT_0048668701 /DNA_START=71 /DNA_END=295 /DNA_ORIENTATION=-
MANEEAVVALEERVARLELLGPRTPAAGGQSAEEERVREENRLLKEKSSKLEFRIKILLRALEEKDRASKSGSK